MERHMSAPLTPAADIALDNAEDALRRLAEDLDAAAKISRFGHGVDLEAVARTIATSRELAAGRLDALAEALPPGNARDQAWTQAAQVRKGDVAAIEAKQWAEAWAAYGDARAVAS